MFEITLREGKKAATKYKIFSKNINAELYAAYLSWVSKNPIKMGEGIIKNANRFTKCN